MHQPFLITNQLKDILNKRLTRPGFEVTIIRHSGGYLCPVYITFYLHFWPPINGNSKVHTEAFEEQNLAVDDATIAVIIGQLNNRYDARRKQG